MKMTTVKVYSTPTCPWCVKAKDFLKKKGIPYEDLDVSKDAKARNEMIEKSGQLGVPVLDVKGTIIVGFDPKSIEAYLDQGLLRYIERDYEQAISDWEKVIELAPSFRNDLEPGLRKARAKLKK